MGHGLQSKVRAKGLELACGNSKARTLLFDIRSTGARGRAKHEGRFHMALGGGWWGCVEGSSSTFLAFMYQRRSS